MSVLLRLPHDRHVVSPHLPSLAGLRLNARDCKRTWKSIRQIGEELARGNDLMWRCVPGVEEDRDSLGDDREQV